MPYHPTRKRREGCAASALPQGVVKSAMMMRSLAVTAVILLTSTAAMAGSEGDIAEAIGKCAAVTDNTARLACYDGIAAHMKAMAAAPQPVAPAAVAPPAAQTAATAPSKEKEESWFGLDLGSWFGATSPAQQTTPQQFGSENLPPPPVAPGEAPPPKPLDSIAATVNDFAYNPYGRFTVFLDDGQIWQQLQGDTGHARFNKTDKDKITISRGLLGSYNLQIDGHDALYKVKRIK
ncbi:MAG: hypothetical protein KGL97_10095 [Alphaproteobacteria bacterium]|nr:hypothetical protein [Alphaproteobacteria bacterium]